MALAPVDFLISHEGLECAGAEIARTRPNTQIASEVTPAAVSNIALPDDLSRDVYCVLGMPIDAIDMAAVLDKIDVAAASKAPFLISTPNLNFLVNSQADPEFRESLLLSDLCPADGMPIVWIARLMGLPIKERIAGSDIFEALRAKRAPAQRLTVFLFGGAEGVAAAAARTLNSEPSGLICVGSIDPGIGTVDELSGSDMIERINSSHADFLAVSLGAKKGQLWLLRNHQRLQIPIRAHLGATISFQAGTVKRAPSWIRRWGLEWLWRIKEEPFLWRRYWNDGRVLLRLLLTRVIPLAISTRWQRLRWQRKGYDLSIKQTQDHESVTLYLSGVATARHIGSAISCFREAVTAAKQVTLDFSDVRAVDARFLGLLLMLRKQLKAQGTSLKFIGLSSAMERIFRLNGVGFLLR